MQPLFQKLSHFLDLTEPELDFLERFGHPEQAVAPRQELIRLNEPVPRAVVMLEGWSVRYRDLPDGRRQVLNFGLPGDVLGLEGSLLRTADYTLVALTPCRVAWFSHSEWPAVVAEQPRLALAILWISFTEQAMFLERLVSLGRRTARERLGHLLCELLARLTLAGEEDGRTFHLPVSQEVLADTLGLSTVHIYRTLQALRRDGLVQVSNGEIDLPDRDALAAEAAFEPAYFHLVPAPWWTEQALQKFEELGLGEKKVS